MSPSEDVKFSNVRGLYLRKYGIQKSDELLLETVWVLSLVENLFLQKNPLQDFLSSLNAVISTNESTEFITGDIGGNLEEKLHYFAAKNGWEG